MAAYLVFEETYLKRRVAWIAEFNDLRKTRRQPNRMPAEFVACRSIWLTVL
ncbi:MAG TPA: hypothetical protein VHV55_25355 [Pirellulales bacterium]|jgi:hypothetical protein|nr:hypothetical protein [Pirellulales bacterium]